MKRKESDSSEEELQLGAAGRRCGICGGRPGKNWIRHFRRRHKPHSPVELKDGELPTDPDAFPYAYKTIQAEIKEKERRARSLIEEENKDDGREESVLSPMSFEGDAKTGHESRASLFADGDFLSAMEAGAQKRNDGLERDLH